MQSNVRNSLSLVWVNSWKKNKKKFNNVHRKHLPSVYLFWYSACLPHLPSPPFVLLSTWTCYCCDIQNGADLPNETAPLLRRPNGKSLHLTRKFHHHFSFIFPSAQNKRHFTLRTRGEGRLCCLIQTHAPWSLSPPPPAPRPLNTLETFSPPCLQGSAVRSNFWSFVNHTGQDSRCTKLIELNSLTYFRGRRGGWSGIR